MEVGTMCKGLCIAPPPKSICHGGWIKQPGSQNDSDIDFASCCHWHYTITKSEEGIAEAIEELAPETFKY